MPELGAPQPDKIRGMSDLPLSAVGRAQAAHLADRIQAKGGVDSVLSSPLRRARQTADAIRQRTGARDLGTTAALDPWHLGQYEGQESNKVAAQLKQYIDNPDRPVAGKGSVSGVPGETFGSFKKRDLGNLAQQHASLTPGERKLMVAHYRNVKLDQAWAKKGSPSNLEIDNEEMQRKGDDPTASLHKIEKVGSQFHIRPIDLESPDKLDAGLYLARHGATEWNAENTASDQPRGRLTKRRIGLSQLTARSPQPAYAGLRGS